MLLTQPHFYTPATPPKNLYVRVGRYYNNFVLFLTRQDKNIKCILLLGLCMMSAGDSVATIFKNCHLGGNTKIIAQNIQHFIWLFHLSLIKGTKISRI